MKSITFNQAILLMAIYLEIIGKIHITWLIAATAFMIWLFSLYYEAVLYKKFVIFVYDKYIAYLSRRARNKMLKELGKK